MKRITSVGEFVDHEYQDTKLESSVLLDDRLVIVYKLGDGQYMDTWYVERDRKGEFYIILEVICTECKGPECKCEELFSDDNEYGALSMTFVHVSHYMNNGLWTKSRAIEDILAEDLDLEIDIDDFILD